MRTGRFLEFGRKLLNDFHAARTLPGYDPNAKLQLLRSLSLPIAVVVINRYGGENEALILERRLKTMWIPSYRRYEIEGYPNDLKKKNFTRQYKSPTDMGFNVLKEGMIDDLILKEAAKKEIVFQSFGR